MPTIDFDAARAERRRERDPLAFVLGGEQFTCLAAIPVGAALDLADAPDNRQHVGFARGLREYLRNIIPDDDMERLDKVLHSKVDPVGVDDLYDVVVRLAEEYTARPTSPSTGSSGGRDSTGTTSSSEPSATALEGSLT